MYLANKLAYFSILCNTFKMTQLPTGELIGIKSQIEFASMLELKGAIDTYERGMSVYSAVETLAELALKQLHQNGYDGYFASKERRIWVTEGLSDILSTVYLNQREISDLYEDDIRGTGERGIDVSEDELSAQLSIDSGESYKEPKFTHFKVNTVFPDTKTLVVCGAQMLDETSSTSAALVSFGTPLKVAGVALIGSANESEQGVVTTLFEEINKNRAAALK